MGGYTEIKRTGKRTIFTKTQIVIYHLGRYRIVRKIYWKYFHIYLWGLSNFKADKAHLWKMFKKIK